MQHWFVKDYATAVTWLQGGRKKHDRPLYSRGLRLQYRSKGNIAVVDRWSGMDIVTYHADDTMTIYAPTVTTHWGSTYNLARSQGVRQVLREYGGFQDVYQKNHNVYLLEYDHKMTPPKIRGCNSCRSTGHRKEWCGPIQCYSTCDHPDKPILNSIYSGRNWHYHACKHGEPKAHTILNNLEQCFRCNGIGKADYGSKPIAMMWDGSPLRIKDGKVINNQPTELEKAIAAYVKTG